MNTLIARQEQQGEWDASANNFFGFIPNIPLSVIYIVVFSLLTMLHLFLTVRSRIWWGLVAVVGGLCEIAGWSGRLAGHWKPEGLACYLLQQVCLVIGPVFFSATCYALMGKLIPRVGSQWSRFKPKTFIIFFVVVDVVCLILQGTGGAMCGQAGGEGNDELLKTGQSIYLAGISVQLFNTVLFAVLTWDYFRQMKKDTNQSVKSFGGLPVFRVYLGVMLVNFLIVFRNGFREAELSEGFDGRLATVEVYVACLDALPMVIAFAALAYCHPSFTVNRIAHPLQSESSSIKSEAEMAQV